MKLAKYVLLIALPLATLNAHAAGSVNHSGQASKHSVLATTHAVGSTAKVASAVVATPLIIAGGVALASGSAAAKAGNSIDTALTHHHAKRQPLVISETTITVDPTPDAAIVIQTKQKTQ